jgi:hypothetical protein
LIHFEELKSSYTYAKYKVRDIFIGNHSKASAMPILLLNSITHAESPL